MVTNILGITDLTAIFSKRPSNMVFEPSARTVVYAENNANPEVTALLSRMGKE